MNKGQTCYSCTYWDKHSRLHEGGEEYGQCRRRAPLVYRYQPQDSDPDVMRDTEWPNTMAYDWCGEYVQKARHA